VLTALCAAFGWLAHHYMPLSLLPDVAHLRIALSVPLFALFFVLAFAAVREFGRHKTSPSPYQPTSAIVTSGVFRHTRNPIYISFVVFILAFAVAANSLWYALAAALLFLLLHYGVVKREERYLSRKFGAAYHEYCQQVRRWL